MSTILNNIKTLIPYLPSKDIPYANKFLEVRNFESLQELVNSSIYIIKKNLKSDKPKEEYLKLDLDKLASLKAEVDLYSTQLEIPELELDEEEEENDDEQL